MNSPGARPEWDVIVVGGSAAGLSAAQLLGRARRRVLVIDDGVPRNRFAAHMHGVLGHDGVPPHELVRRGREEAVRYGVQFLDGTVRSVEDVGGGLLATLDGGALAGGVQAPSPGTRPTAATGGAHTCRGLIAATGLTDELPDIPGLAERWGTGVLHCPYCHGWEVADQHLGVLATSPASLHQAQMVRQWSDRVTLFSAAMGEIAPEVEARLRARGVRIVPSAVVEVHGDDGRVTGVRTADGRETGLDALFTSGAPRPHDDFLGALGLTRSELPFGMGSFLAVDPTGRTSHGRVWAAGNVANPMANVPVSVGEGALAGTAVNRMLVEEDFASAGRGE